MKEDIILLGGEFLAAEIPAEKQWMLRYCHSETLKKFAVYYITFRELTKRVSLRYYCQLFIDHTGCSCSIMLLCRIAKRIRDLEAVMQTAEQAKDLETLSKIKLGSYKLKKDLHT